MSRLYAVTHHVAILEVRPSTAYTPYNRAGDLIRDKSRRSARKLDPRRASPSQDKSGLRHH